MFDSILDSMYRVYYRIYIYILIYIYISNMVASISSTEYRSKANPSKLGLSFNKLHYLEKKCYLVFRAAASISIRLQDLPPTLGAA